MTHHYNTTNEAGTQLRLFDVQAENQENEVMRVLGLLKAASPSKIYKYLGTKYPITSIRRALTNLTQTGKLTKTDSKATGLYGRPEYVWKANQ